MATHRWSILGNLSMDAGVFTSLVGAQITAAAAPSIANQLCVVLSDGGSDRGFYTNFPVPKNYVGSPAIVFKGVLDGAPGASDALGLGVRKKAVANNEAADGTYDSEEVNAPTIGSSGSNHSDEDSIEVTVNLTAGHYAIDDDVGAYFFIDASGNTYAGNFLLTDLLFQYTDV